MDVNLVPFWIWFVVMFAWGRLAPVFTPYLRNITGIVMSFAALCLFFPVRREWPVLVIMWGVMAGVEILGELYPKDERKHFYWREKVTFLQDFLVMTSSFLLMTELMILLGH